MTRAGASAVAALGGLIGLGVGIGVGRLAAPKGWSQQAQANLVLATTFAGASGGAFTGAYLATKKPLELTA